MKKLKHLIRKWEREGTTFSRTIAGAVFAAAVLFVSCSNGLETPPQPPGGKSDGNAVLASFTLRYGDVEGDISQFAPDKFTYDIPAALGHTSLIAEGTAKEGSLLKISAVCGTVSAGSMDDFAASGVLKDISIPEAGKDTVISVEVKNGTAGQTYHFTVRLPLIQMKGLSVKYSGEAAELLNPAFDSAVYEYEINADAGKTIDFTPDLDAGQVIAGVTNNGAAIPSAGGVYNVPVPAAGSGQSAVKIVVSSNAGAGFYTIKLVPPQSQAQDDYTLRTLTLSWVSGGSDVIQGFSKTNATYSVSVDTASRNTAFLSATASSQVAKIKLWYDNAEASAQTFTGGLTAQTVNLPPKNGAPLVVHIKVFTGSQTGSKTYMITINPYVEQKSLWSGTVVNAGSPNWTIVAVSARNASDAPIQATLASLAETTSTTWTFQAAANYTPSFFFVTLYDKANGKEYASGELPYTGTSKTGITLTVKETGQLINNAQEIISNLGTGGTGGNVALGGDINLGDNSLAWDGPENYNGHFYGNGFAVVNLKLNSQLAANGKVGFFKSLADGAFIENVTVNVSTEDPNGTISGINFGGIAGEASGNVTIRNVTVNGHFEFANFSNAFSVGGLLAGAGAGSTETNPSIITIENCASTMNISIPTGSNSSNNTGTVGGIVASIGTYTTVTIKNCYTSGNITIANSGDRKFFAGGLAGSLAYALYNNNLNINHAGTAVLNIENCYTSGNVIIDNSNRTDWRAGLGNDNGRIVAGGMVGIRQTAGIVNIKNSIALGEKTLTLIPASAEIGSLVNIPNDPHNGKYKIQLPDMTSLYFDSPQPARNYSGETGRLIGSHGESVFDYAAVFGVTDPQSPRTVCAFNNNLARINMLTGFDAAAAAAAAAVVPGDTNQKEGGGKILDEFKQKSVWTALGFNETVWDLSGVPQGKWPTLR